MSQTLLRRACAAAAVALCLTTAAPALANEGCTACACAAGEATTLTKHEQDRRAILAMAGEYAVDFQFAETIAIAPGYEIKSPYLTDATEFVEVVVDEPDRIDLQHVLVLHPDDGGEPRVIKHWRQSWRYEDDAVREYAGNKTWTLRQLSEAERAGTWSQAVYQVDDSPRYESFGTWTHAGGVSAWQGNETWRPLPRREYTKRDDYHVMAAVNRHTLTPTGWVHEQDNQKVVLADDGSVDRVLCREVGLNVYDRVGEGSAANVAIDFSAGREYWQATAPFWADVRDAWERRLESDGVVALKAEVDGERLGRRMFAYANDVADAGTYDADAGKAFIEDTLEAFDAATGAESASAR